MFGKFNHLFEEENEANLDQAITDMFLLTKSKTRAVGILRMGTILKFNQMKNLIKNGTALSREEQKVINGGGGPIGPSTRCDVPYIVMDPSGDGTYVPTYVCPTGYYYDETRNLCCQA